MNNFTFHNPTKIIFGMDKIRDVRLEIPNTAKILMIYGQLSIKENGIYAEISAALKEHNIIEFSGIEPNPNYEYLVKALDIIRAKNIDFILAVGGGSVIDAAKFISVAAFFNNPWDEMSSANKYTRFVPVGVILTLPATGSEMNGSFTITRKQDNYKRLFLEPPVYPVFSILDPKVVASLPSRQIANGIIDAFSHVIEQYITYPTASYLQDRFSEGILRTLIEIGNKVMVDPTNYELSSNLMWCTTMALNKLIGCGVPQDWSSHMIGHELTSVYGIDHARTLAILLPVVLSVKKQQKLDKLCLYAKNVWGITQGSKETIADEVIQKTEQFFRSFEIKTKLHEYDIFDASEVIPEKMQQNHLFPVGEHLDIGMKQVKHILNLCR